MTMKILIILLLALIIWAILKWAIKFVGGIWGIGNKNFAAGIGVIILAASFYIMYNYGEKGILLFGSILVLLFFGLKHYMFNRTAKIKKDEDDNYLLVKEQLDNGVDNDQIATDIKVSLEFVNRTANRIALSRYIDKARTPRENSEELAKKFSLEDDIDYVKKCLNYRVSGGMRTNEPIEIDPVIIFYLLVLLFLGFKIYYPIYSYVNNDFISSILSCLLCGFLLVPIVIGYVANPTSKRIITWSAYLFFLFVICYQIYSWR